MTFWRPITGASTHQLDEPSVVTIGNFDGVHRGHQFVLARARSLARTLAPDPLPMVAVTFDPHPVAVLAPDRAPATLTTLVQRIELLKRAGADFVHVLAFDRQMSGWTPGEFAQRVLVDQLSAAGVVVGENFRYGNRAAGNVETLRDFGEAHGFVVEGLALDGGDEDHSSTLVRQRLAAGDVSGAAAVLGRHFSVEGEVVQGDRRGRDIGFPTANIALADGVVGPADGVYAGWLVRVDGERLPAAVSVGSNPTFGGVDRRVESYVLDVTDLDLYGERITVEFVRRLRGMERFDSVDELVAQMERDVTQTRLVLDSRTPEID